MFFFHIRKEKKNINRPGDMASPRSSPPPTSAPLHLSSPASLIPLLSSTVNSQSSIQQPWPAAQDHRSAAGRGSAPRCSRWPSSLSFAGDASARSKGAMPASPASISSCFAAAPLTFCSHHAVYPWRPRLRCFPGTNPNFCSSVGATDLYVDMDSGSSCMS